MTLKNLHVVATFNTENKVLKLDYRESQDEFEVIGQSSKKIMDFEISEFLGNDIDRAKSIIGNTVLGLFNSIVDGGIGLPVYVETPAEIQAEKVLKEFAENGDTSMMFSLGLTYMHKSRKLNQVNYLEEAQYWFEKAAEHGSEDAIEYLEKHWQSIKDDMKNRIIKEITKNKNDL